MLARTRLLGYLLCGGVIGLLAMALLVVAGNGVPRGGALVALLLVGGTLPLASAAWGGAFRQR